jgi:hypothetical protein
MTNTNTNTAISLNKAQMTSLIAIYNATDSDLFVPKNDLTAQKATLKEIGVSARIFGVLFEKGCLKWARLEDGTTVASLTAKCARMVDNAAAPAADDTTAQEPVMPETPETVAPVKLTRGECYDYLIDVAKQFDTKAAIRAESLGVADLREMVRTHMETATVVPEVEPVSEGVSSLTRAQIRALVTLINAMDAAPITQAEYDAGTVDVISKRMFNFFFDNKLLRIVRSRANGPIIALTSEAKSLLRGVTPAATVAPVVTPESEPVVPAATVAPTSPQSKRTRALRAKIEDELAALEAAIAAAEKNGESLTGREIQKRFLINFL